MASSKPGSSLELGLLGERIVGNLGTKNDNQLGINMTYTWGGSSTAKPMVYAVTKLSDLENLRNWVTKPAVHMEQVLALKDESRITLTGGKTSPVNTVGLFVPTPEGEIRIRSINCCNGSTQIMDLVSNFSIRRSPSLNFSRISDKRYSIFC